MVYKNDNEGLVRLFSRTSKLRYIYSTDSWDTYVLMTSLCHLTSGPVFRATDDTTTLSEVVVEDQMDAI